MFSVQTLPNHENIVATIIGDQNVLNGWIYPGLQKHQDFMSRKISLVPYNTRVFGLPKTHVLTLHKRENQEELDFVVWCLSFFTGMRLSTTEAGFLDATPVCPGKLVDFSLSRSTLADVIQLALNYLETEHSDPHAPKRVAAVIHALFLAQYPQNLPFEEFQYLYMALDACYSLVVAKEAKKIMVPHAERIQWVCKKFSLPVPEWADSTMTGTADLSIIRNNAFHEALFFAQPLGFAVYGGNQTATNQSNVTLQMKALVCRLLVAILGKPGISYTKTPVNTRQQHALELV